MARSFGVFLRTIVAMCLVVICGCGQPKIDGRSNESFRDSLKRVSDSLDAAGRDRLEKSVRVLVFADVNSPADMMQMMSNPGSLEATTLKIKDRLNGKTAQEIFAEADEVKAKRKTH